MKSGTGRKIFCIGNYAFMGLYALIMVIPVLYILQLTLSSHPDPSFRLWPRQFTLDNYRYVVEHGMILRPLWNSVYLSVVSTCFSLVLTSLVAYPLSDKGLPGRRFFNFLVLITIMIHLGFLPKYLLVKDLGLMNTYWSLILTGGISSFNVILMRNYFQSLPREMFESARIDGARERTVLARIVFPLSLPVMATISLFYFVDNWNEYFSVILYIQDRAKHTLQVILQSIIILEEDMGGGDLNVMMLNNVKYTTVIVALVPIVMLYPFLQKYFTKGILLGSVKG